MGAVPAGCLTLDTTVVRPVGGHRVTADAPQAPGGIGTYVEHISHLLAEAGETVHVIGQRWLGAPKVFEEFEGGRLIIHRVSLDTPIPVARNNADFRTAERELAGLARVPYHPLRFAWQAGLLAEKLVDDEGIDVIEAQEFAAPLYFFQLVLIC